MKAIGICNRTKTVVYETDVKGYSAYCPELDEDLYDMEWTKFDENITELEITLLVMRDEIVESGNSSEIAFNKGMKEVIERIEKVIKEKDVYELHIYEKYVVDNLRRDAYIDMWTCACWL